MPWMPEVFTGPLAEEARRSDEEAAPTNDAIPYYEGILAQEPDALIRSFAAQQPRLNDPRVGYVEGARELRTFVDATVEWLRERDAVVENMALTRTPTRTVEEVVLHLLSDDGERVELPVATVTDRNPDRTLKTIRVYHSMWPLTGEHRVRPPLLPADPELHPEGAPGDYQRALAEGDLAGIVGTFEPDGYVREPSGSQYIHRGSDELRAFYAALFSHGGRILQRGPEPLRSLYETLFSNGGRISLEHCTLTDDGTRCAIEYNCVRWGLTDIPPQAGVAIYERGSSGLLAAARIYDDVEQPAVSDASAG